MEISNNNHNKNLATFQLDGQVQVASQFPIPKSQFPTLETGNSQLTFNCAKLLSLAALKTMNL